MIRRLFAAFLVVIASLALNAGPALAAEPITGRWITEDRDAVVEIKQCGRVICGRIARFLITPPDGADQRDINNPDTALRKRKLLGLPILTQFREDGSKWRGRIYDPNNGKSYRSVLVRKDANTLEVSGCIGPFCQTQTWKRAR